jgi:hypothetical protein
VHNFRGSYRNKGITIINPKGKNMKNKRSKEMNEIVERIKKSFALHNIKLTEQKFEDLVPKSKGGNAEG